MISHEHRCIFVHIPKTGGASIEDLLWPDREGRTTAELWMGFVAPHHNKYQTGGLQHLLARQIRTEVGASCFADYFKFSIVRNPFDKAVSQFVYMRRRKDLREFLGMRARDDFKTYLELTRKKVHVQWEQQHRFLCDDDGEPLVDFIGRFEQLTTSVQTVFAELHRRTPSLPERPGPLPHRNRSRRRHYSQYYDDESIELVRSIYADDIERFGYRFETG